MMRFILGLLGALALFGAQPALADITYTQGSGTTIFDFTCFSTKHCTAGVVVNSAGTEIFTSANPAQVTGANGTFPVTGSTSNASSAVATSSTNLGAVSWNYGFNGTTWDQLQVDGSKNLKINCVTGCSGTGGSSQQDNTAFTAGTTNMTVMGCFDATTTLSATSAGAVACTTARSVHTLDDNSAAALAQLQNINTNLTGASNCLTATTGTTPGPYSNGQAEPISCTLNGALYVVPQSDDPCQKTAHSFALINYSSSGLDATPIVAGVSSKKTYVCQLTVNNNAALSVALLEATTGTSCSTSQLGLWGGTTAATGFNLAATSGIVIGNGSARVAATTVNNNDICIITSTATQVSGRIEYVQL